MSDDIVYEHIENRAKGGDILDLGCGPGAVGVELKVEAYSSYTGVDICDVAIERARSRAAQSCRADKNTYSQADILTYMPTQNFDVIFFGDSIYYFSWQKVTEILGRYAERLKENAVFIVRTWTLKEKHRTLVNNIEKSFHIIAKHTYERGELVVLIFRPFESGKEPSELGAPK
jgi:SAM-dependent methyltransferase